jgi:enamine deaminase RidA (YjgF/YER057c/UK114 family)
VSAIERRLKELDIELPAVSTPAGSYVPWVRSGSLLFVSGQVPFDEDGKVIAGQVGADLTLEQAQDAARRAGLSLIAVAREALPSLDAVERVVRIGGFVNAPAGFTQHPQVVNGCSNLMLEVWGDRGRHARAAVGVSGLPLGAVVEVDAIFAVGG